MHALTQSFERTAKPKALNYHKGNKPRYYARPRRRFKPRQPRPKR